jgi:hypothetical protein
MHNRAMTAATTATRSETIPIDTFTDPTRILRAVERAISHAQAALWRILADFHPEGSPPPKIMGDAPRKKKALAQAFRLIYRVSK